VLHSKGFLCLNCFAIFVTQSLPIIIFVNDNIFEGFAHLCPDGKPDVFVKTKINNASSLAIGEYVYQSIATNLEGLTDSEIIHFYNQRGEDSENRIKELN
jgi:hypothetical protein